MQEKTPGPVLETEGILAETRMRDSDFVMAGPHCHKCYELFYAEKGSCRFLIDENIFDLQAGDIILVPPRALHYTRYVFGPCLRTVILFGREDVLREVWNGMMQADLYFAQTSIFWVPEPYRDKIGQCIRRMTEETGAAESASEQLEKIYLQELLLLCSRYCVLRTDSPADIRTRDVQILHAVRYIGKNYMHPLTTKDVADAVGFSPNYLSRRFRRAAGIGLHEYIVFVRLQHAARELISSSDTVTDIALRCGFSDGNYFKDAFKKKYGVTPRAYRKIS